ncbi:3-oxoacyl-ACP reductase FabG [Methanofollis formosanus]|uniref:3-oxoacyl-ACP reductase FabG n=1 Tax=Methanofollis formosanus TaxID=299308 RepID=A0A8G1A2J2_9EURY|nr:3-oxoacyl-ACP reductase family protein [Methanofollis formosanus]QYZ79895.1 3-oxoacyl-ACP reductase FabG [Methanofollis formosanus]
MLQGKVMLITGAGRGIGRATALLAAENHAQVIVNYNNSEDAADELLALIAEKGYNAAVKIRADVSKEDEVKRMFKEIKSQFGRLDILVNNAGIMRNNLLMMTRVDELNSMYDINCKGTFLCSQSAAKMMMKQNSGKIVNVSSIVGTHGNNGQSAYSASKSFIVGFTTSTAKELGRYNITVNAIAPGLIATDMTKDLKEEVRAELIDNVALARIGTPEDVAKVVLFLASPLADYVSGQVIGVDGCQVM